MSNGVSDAYRCKIFRPNSRAWLKLGTRRRLVEVIEQSRDTFTVQINSGIAKKIEVGREFRLLYQDMLWSVLCRQKWVNREGLVDVEFEPIAELTPPEMPRVSLIHRSKTVSTNQPIDTTLAVMILCSVILFILIVPAWGGQWGTSKVICDSITNVWKASTGLILNR